MAELRSESQTVPLAEGAEALRAQLLEVEKTIEAGAYKPGPWDRFIRAARNQPPPVRAALADDATRVSRKLHLRTGRTTMPLERAILWESSATIIGAVLLAAGVASKSNVLAMLGALTWTTTFQPLVKVAVGTALGVSFDYAYLEGSFEPRFKISYGTYLARPRWARILFHLSGIVGSPLGIYLAGVLMAPVLPTSAKICDVIFWILNVVNLVSFVGGIISRRKLGPLRVASSSGGVAGAELHDAFTIARG
jgi:hypothetical protein